MKIIIDNQSKLDITEFMGLAFTLISEERKFIEQNITGCHFITKSMKITTNVWQDSEGLHFRITDLGKKRAKQ